MAKFRTLLKNRNFVLYSIGQAFSQFGDRLVQIVLIGFVYKRWPGSTLQLAKLFFFTVLPSFFISPVAGVYIDRWNKKYVMIISDMFRAIGILLVPLFFVYSKSIAPIYAIIFFVFASACFFLPARLSIIPSLVSKADILLANSASSITWVVSGIAGFSLGGILVEWFGVRNSLFLNSLVYILSAASFLFLVHSPHRIKTVLKKSFLYELVDGLKTLLFNKKIKFVAAMFFTVASMFGALYVVSVVFIQESLGSMTKDVGIFSVCAFVGLLIGSYIYGKAGQRLLKMKTVFISFCLAGLFIDVFALSLRIIQSLWAGSVSAFLLGFFIAPIYVTANTVIHESIDSNLRGRIFSSMSIIVNLGFLSFMFISSIAAEHINRFWILIACGCALVIFGLVGVLAGFLKDFISSS